MVPAAAGTAMRLPLLVQLATVLAASMYVPAVHALLRNAHPEAQAFFYAGTLLLAGCGAVALASARRAASNATRSHLLALLGAMTLLPAMAAVPLYEAVADTRPVNAYVEMVAALTTTGGSLFAADRLSPSLHLWRALVAWQGGLLMLVAGVSILAPLRLGGFEVTYTARLGQSARLSPQMQAADPESRVRRYFLALAPIYGGLTLSLWFVLSLLGEAPTDGAILAMSILSTSGISSGAGIAGSAAGLPGEAAAMAFLLFAVSRQTFAGDAGPGRLQRLIEDREMRIAAAIVVAMSGLLLLRHWTGAVAVDAVEDLGAALRAIWGASFTVLSFLTTTGFESAEWDTARAWSGFDTPIVLLLGLAMFGGGVATTAGGVKLLRIYALYEHGRREMHKLVHPHTVSGGQGVRARIPMRGVEAAWVFFMLFAITIAVFSLALAAAGQAFPDALILTIAALTTTGPLADLALGTGPARGLGSLSDATKAIWAAAMVVGRLETLALIALFNPDFWRR